MVLTIKNFGNPVWPWIIETAPTNLSATAWVLKATLTWTSATGESWVVWTEEKLVRKEWSAPQWSMDWTVVTTITTKDTYATNWYEDTGLDSTKTYYYKAFAIYDNGTERGSTDVNVTPEEFEPTVNTLLWYPLETNANDYSGRWQHLTPGSWITFGTYGGIQCASFNETTNAIISGNVTWLSLGNGPRTTSVWIYQTRVKSSSYYVSYWTKRKWQWWAIIGQNQATLTGAGYLISCFSVSWNANDVATGLSYYVINSWVNIVSTSNGNNVKLYVNGELATTKEMELINTQWSNVMFGATQSNDTFPWYMSNVIIEDYEWTATQIADYYNWMKTKYWHA